MPYFSRTLGLVQLLLLGQSPHHAVRASKSDGLEVTAVDDIPYHALSPQETVHLLTQYAGLALPIHFEEGGQLGLQKHLDLAIPTSASVSKGENEKGKAQKTQVATGGDEQSSYDGPNLPELQQALETERTAFYLTGLPGGSTVGPSHRKVLAYQTAAERGETVAKLLKHLIGEDHDGGAPAQEVDRSTRPTIAGLNDPATVLLEKARNVRLLYEPDSRSYSQTALHAAMSPKAGEFYVYKGDEADEQSAAENKDNEEQEQVDDVVYIGNNATTFEYMLDFIMKNDLDLLTAVNSPGGSSPTKVAALANGSGTIAAGSASVSVEGTTVQSFQRLETAVGGHTQQLLRLDGRHSLLKFAAENAIFTRNENVPAHVNEEADYLQIVKLLLKKYYPENAQDLQSFAKASSYFDETWSWESQKDRGWNKNAIQRPEKQAKLEQDYHFYQQFSSKYLEAKNLGDEPVISKSSMSYFVDGEQSFLEWVLVKCSESLPVEEKAEQVEGENAEGLDGEGEEEDEHQGTTGADAAAASNSEEAVDKTLQMSKPCDFLIPELLRRGATVKNVLPTAVRDANLAGYLPALLTSMMRSYGNEPKQIQELHQDLRASYNDDGETLLHFAVEADNLEAIKLLLQFDDGISSAHGRDEDAAWSRLKKTLATNVGSSSARASGGWSSAAGGGRARLVPHDGTLRRRIYGAESSPQSSLLSRSSRAGCGNGCCGAWVECEPCFWRCNFWAEFAYVNGCYEFCDSCCNNCCSYDCQCNDGDSLRGVETCTANGVYNCASCASSHRKVSINGNEHKCRSTCDDIKKNCASYAESGYKLEAMSSTPEWCDDDGSESAQWCARHVCCKERQVCPASCPPGFRRRDDAGYCKHSTCNLDWVEDRAECCQEICTSSFCEHHGAHDHYQLRNDGTPAQHYCNSHECSWSSDRTRCCRQSCTALTVGSGAQDRCHVGGGAASGYFLREPVRQCPDTTCDIHSHKEWCCIEACQQPHDSDERFQFEAIPDWNTVLLRADNFYPGRNGWQSSPTSGGVTWQCKSPDYSGTSEFRCHAAGDELDTKGCFAQCRCDHGSVENTGCPLPGAERCHSCTDPDLYEPRTDGHQDLQVIIPYNGHNRDVTEVRCWAMCSPLGDCSQFTEHSATGRVSYYQRKRRNHNDPTTEEYFCEHERLNSASLFPTECKSSCCEHACRTPPSSETVGYAIDFGIALRDAGLYPGGSNDNFVKIHSALCDTDYHSEYSHERAEMRCNRTGGGEDVELRGCIPTCRCTVENDASTVLGDAEQDTTLCPGPAMQRCRNCGRKVNGGEYDFRPDDSNNGEVRCWASCRSISTCKQYGTTSSGAYWVKDSSVTYCSQQKYAGAAEELTSTQCRNCCAIGCKAPTAAANVPYSILNLADVLTDPDVAFPSEASLWRQHNYVECASTPGPGYHPSDSDRPRLRCPGGGERIVLDGCQPTCYCSQLSDTALFMGTIDQSHCNSMATPGNQACGTCEIPSGGKDNYKTVTGLGSAASGSASGPLTSSERLCWAHCDAEEFLDSGRCVFYEGGWWQNRDPAPPNNLCSQSVQMYDQQLCRTSCCVQGCREPATPEGGKDSPYNVNSWETILRSPQLYPGRNPVGVTLWEAAWGHGCAAGFYGTPAFECRASGAIVIADGCTDNCWSFKNDASLCYDRGYGDPMLAHERRDYFSAAHVAAEPQTQALPAEECCKRDTTREGESVTMCGGMFLYDGDKTISVAGGVAARASDYCSLRGFGQPIADLTTVVPTSSASEKEAECCGLPSCDIGFFGAPKDFTCPERLQNDRDPTGFIGHTFSGSSKFAGVCTTRACNTTQANLWRCCEMRGVCPHYYEGETAVTPDPYHIQTSSYFRKTEQVNPQPPHFDCHLGSVAQSRDLWVSSEAKLNYCVGRDCNAALDLNACCVLYEEHGAFNETVPLAEAGVNLTAAEPSAGSPEDEAQNATSSDAAAFVSTLSVKRFYYCDDSFTPEFYWSEHQAWAACNEYGVYCHGYQFDPTFLRYRANYTEGKHYSVLLSFPAEDIPDAALLSTSFSVPLDLRNATKYLPVGAPSVSFTVHCAKVDARFADRNLTSGETVYYEDDEYVRIWMKKNRQIDTSALTVEDLGALHPEEEEDAAADARVGGSSNFRLRMIVPASAGTIVDLIANETGVIKGALSAAMNARLSDEDATNGNAASSSTNNSPSENDDEEDEDQDADADTTSTGVAEPAGNFSSNFSSALELDKESPKRKLKYTGRRAKASAFPTSEKQGGGDRVEVLDGHFVLTTASGNGSNVNTTELSLTEEVVHSHWDPLDVRDDISDLFDTDRQFTLSINLDHTGTGTPVVGDEDREARLNEILTRHLHKHILREQNAANGLTQMTEESLAVQVADVGPVEAVGAGAGGRVEGEGGLVEGAPEQQGQDDSNSATGADDGESDPITLVQDGLPTSTMGGAPPSWCELEYHEPPNLGTWQETLSLLACVQAVVCVLLFLIVMRHRIMGRTRQRPEQYHESDEWWSKVAQRQVELGLADDAAKQAVKLAREAKRAAEADEGKQNRKAQEKADKIVAGDLRESQKGDRINVAQRGGGRGGFGASTSEAFGAGGSSSAFGAKSSSNFFGSTAGGSSALGGGGASSNFDAAGSSAFGSGTSKALGGGSSAFVGGPSAFGGGSSATAGIVKSSASAGSSSAVGTV